MLRLNKNQRLIDIGMLQAGLRPIDIAEHLDVSRGNIILLAACYGVFGTCDDLTMPFKTVTFTLLLFTSNVDCRGYYRS